MFLRQTFHLNFLHGPLPCSSSCHRSLGERLCMTCIIEFTRYYFTFENWRSQTCFCSFSWSCIKNLITQHSYLRYMIWYGSSSSKFYLAQLLMTFPFPDRYRAALSSFSRSRNEQENSKFHYIFFSITEFLLFWCFNWFLERRKVQGKKIQFSVPLLWFSSPRIATIKLRLQLCLCKKQI